MKKQLICIIASLMAVCSCGLSETGQSQRPAGDGSWRNPAFSNDSTSTDRKRCYVTGLDYPDGYNWRSDTENGTVKCSLVVFRDGIPAMKIPVGHEYNVSPDPDMHRVIKGHLYTDYSTDGQTVIKKDGQEIFRYQGREMILGMAVSDGDIYTLGQPRQGEGFTYRRNGEPLVQRTAGHAFPRLQTIGDTICFAFCEPIESVSGNMERYYHVRGGKISQVAVREDVRKVWDVIWHRSQVCYLATMTGVPSPVTVTGNQMKALELSDGIDMLTSRLLSAGNSLGVEAICTHNAGYSSSLWKDARKYSQFSNGMTVNGICTVDDGICCVLNSGSGNGGGIIFRCGETVLIPEGMAAMGHNPIAMMNGILHVGLSSLSGGPPAIWKDGQCTELDINGMICTVTVE